MDQKAPQPVTNEAVVAQPSPTPEPAPVTPVAEKKSSNSPVMVTITVMVILALGVAGFFFVKSNGQPKKIATTYTTTITSTQPSPTIDPADENGIESIDVGDTETTDLTSVEKDIESL